MTAAIRIDPDIMAEYIAAKQAMDEAQARLNRAVSAAIDAALLATNTRIDDAPFPMEWPFAYTGENALSICIQDGCNETFLCEVSADGTISGDIPGAARFVHGLAVIKGGRAR